MMVVTVLVVQQLQLLQLQVDLQIVTIVYTIGHNTVLSAVIQHGLSLVLIVLH